MRLIETLQYLPERIRDMHVNSEELARQVFETQDISTKNLLNTPEQVAQSQQAQAEAAQVALELDRARANKLNASAEAQRATTAMRLQKQEADTLLAGRKQAFEEQSAQSDRELEASKVLGDLAKARMNEGS